MNLIIDIGNTRVKLAVFQGALLKQKFVWDKLEGKRLKELIKKKKIERVAISSVVGLKKSIEQFLKKHHQLLLVDHTTQIPIVNKYKTPKTLGKDRLAAVIGANHLFPKKNNLIIDTGTCIKYDLITAKGTYLGGSISPGVNMRMEAMHEFTAKLPLVKKQKWKSFIGNNTKTCLQTGGGFGALMEIEGFIRTYKKEFSRLNVILTGGDADFFANQLKTKIFVNQNLILIGINKILTHNAI